MNKKMFFTTLIFLALTLTACASASQTPGAATEELPTQTKVTLGILKLEDTETAITTEQAKELLPMFHVLKDLNDSDTSAQEEIDGLVNQIQETLTQEQLQAIDTMSLSMRDVFSYTQGNANGSGGSSNASSANSGGGAAGGPPDMGAGGPPDMSGMPPSSASGNTSSSTTTSAMPTISTSTPSALFDSVIELLQKKIQS
ncbi:MAG: hypothetical protein U0Z26_16060 [Anaerolineales bacterium]